MILKNLGIILLMSLATAMLVGCATADKEPLVKGTTTTRPAAVNAQPSNAGSLFPATAAAASQFRPLFEDPRVLVMLAIR